MSTPSKPSTPSAGTPPPTPASAAAAAPTASVASTGSVDDRPPLLTARRRPHTSGRVLFTTLAVLVLGVPLGVSLIDAEADDPGKFSIILWIGWILCATLGGLVLAHIAQRYVSAPSAVLALATDGLPLLLLIAWLLVVPAFVTAHWLLGSLASGLCLYHLHLVVPRFRAAPAPPWVTGSPTFRLCVANVYVDNPTPDEAASALVQTGADAIVIVESTPRFMEVFDAAGGRDAYPHRVEDPDDHSDYAVTIACREPLRDGSRAETDGDLRVMRAVLSVGGRDVTVFGINPMATVDRGGYRTWRSQLRSLRKTLVRVRGPVVVAGDLNSSRFRPEFAALLSVGLRDVHDQLGHGLRPSFRLSNSGLLGAIGPVARLDHALVSHDIHPVDVADLSAHGSDHVPFVTTLAVRARGGG